MRYKYKLQLSVIPLIIIPAIIITLIFISKSSSTIETLQLELMKVKLDVFKQKCNDEEKLLRRSKQTDSEFYVNQAKAKMINESRRLHIPGGYIYVVHTDGRIIYHPELKNGFYNNPVFGQHVSFIQKMIKHGKNLKPTQKGYISYHRNIYNRKNHTKVGVFDYFDGWDWIIVAVANKNTVFAAINNSINISLLTLLILILTTGVILYFFANGISKPIEILKETSLKMAEGDLDVQVDIKTRDEFNILGKTYNSMARKIKEHTNTLESKVKERTLELQAKNDKIMNDLSIARKIQETIIKTMPETPELLIDAQYVSMESLGGDVYDIKRIGKTTYSFLIADVSGHGVPAALITTMAKTSFINRSHWKKTTANVCGEVNQDLFNLIGDTEHYLTAFYATLDLSKMTLEFTNCGHHHGIIFRADTNKIELLESEGFFIGIMQEVEYTSHKVKINIKDKIFLFTDGIPEARNEKGSFYTNKRLEQLVEKYGALSPKEFLDKLTEDVQNFTGTRPPDDDRAFLVIQVISSTEHPGAKNAKELPDIQESYLSFEELNAFNKTIKMLNLDTMSLNSQINKAIKKINSKKTQEAKDLLGKLVTFFPENTKILNALGVLAYREKNYENALEYFEKIKEIAPDFKDIDITIGKVKSNVSEALSTAIS